MANPNGGIAGGPATAAMRRQDNSTFLSNFVHWLWFGNRPGAGLAAVPGQFMSSINPTNRAGLLNLASMFTPGGKFDASPRLSELGMPHQFEPYSVGKAAVGGHLGHDKAPDAFLEALKAGNHQHAHDLLFGGTVHARGAIPKRPAFDAPPTDTAAAIAQKLGISPAKVRAQMQAAEKAQANAAREQAITRVLYNHGMGRSDHLAESTMRNRMEEARLSDRTYQKQSPRSQNLAQIKQMASAKRAAALQRILAQRMMHNHRN